MQAIELETTIIKGEIHVKLPTEITAEKARLLVLYEEAPKAVSEASSGLLQLLDNLTAQRNWPEKTKTEIDNMLNEERESWD
ncbi:MULTISPECIES: hypothetical protein [Methylomicrobium]|uniref:Uncharacterized protein n=1 Tax=Methylomicrobium album BG8 TaxID=686340 RepID=H8GQQ9_METAL|nr:MULTISPECIES: hypothetical protein [Methylomicrobium]EIC31044.1 hypothetical protein Metal_3384 [Methylomicrobium album BG8]